MRLKLKLTPKLLLVCLVVAIAPLIVLEIDTQIQVRSLLAALPVDAAARCQALAWRQQIGFGVTMAMALIFAAVTAIVFGRSIVRPIHRLQANARRLLAGEFPTFELSGAEDELTELAGALQDMSTGLRALVAESELHSRDVERLYQEARRRTAALEMIRDVGQRISTILNLDDLLPEVVELIRSGFDCDRVHLLTVDQAAGELVFRAGAGRAGRVGAEAGERIPIGPGSVVGQVASTGQPVLSRDLVCEPRQQPSPEAAGYAPLAKTRSELAVPLARGERIIGVLSAQSDGPEAFDDKSLFVLQELASQAAGAIVNAELYEEAFSRAEEVMVLLITSVAVSTAPGLDVRLEAIAHHARHLMNAEGCTVYRLDGQANTLRPLISLDLHSERMMALPVPVGEGIAGRVVQSGQGEIANHVELEPHALGAPGAAGELGCVLAVPLLVSDRTIGAMTVRRRGAREFAQHDLELLTMFASQAAVAIENAELYQQLKERAESLQQALAELEEADRLKDEMIQNISHELRTPLTFIIGYLGLTLDGSLGPLTSQQYDGLRLVSEKAHALTRMVDDIITLQTIRITSLQLELMDIADLARQAVDVVRPAAERAAIRIVTDLAGPVYVNGEWARLAQVFDNLLGNAIKFSPDGGTITVGITQTPDEVCVRVEDTGIGIPAGKLEKVFERFYQVDGTATRRFGGVGMGLPVCREIIAAHRGRIWAESPTSGEHGSTFYFTLPSVSQFPPASSD